MDIDPNVVRAIQSLDKEKAQTPYCLDCLGLTSPELQAQAKSYVNSVFQVGCAAPSLDLAKNRESPEELLEAIETDRTKHVSLPVYSIEKGIGLACCRCKTEKEVVIFLGYLL